MNKNIILILSLLIAASISSCEKDCGNLDLYGTDADILSCRVTAGETTVYGFIGKDKILIKLPESIDIENINVSLELSA